MALIFGTGNVMFLVILNGLTVGLCQGFLFSGVVMHVREGEQAILKCTITEHIPTWTSPSGGFINSHDFAFLSPSSPFRNRMWIATNGDLIINNTRDYDRGDYLCSYPGLDKQTVRLIVADPLSTTTKPSSTLRPTECCICDDTSPDLSRRCSEPNICANSFTTCDYCETERNYTGSEWKTTRRCGDKDSCTAKLYLTAAEAGCKVNGSPRPGISCYSCCLTTDRNHPFFCVSNPDTNQVDFKITTATTVQTSETTTETSSTTSQSTTKTSTSTPPSTKLSTSTPSSTQLSTSTSSSTKLSTSTPSTTQAVKTSTWQSTISSGAVISTKAGVDGGWSEWLSWSGCSSQCIGVRVRIRTCSRPFPGQNGANCPGTNVEEEVCQPSNCNISCTVPTVSNATPVPSSIIHYNYSVTYNCETGYNHTTGDLTRSCKADGSLTGSTPVCTIIICTVPTVFNATPVPPSTIDYNSDVTYTCETGYSNTAGDLTRRCRANGSLTGSTPVCTAIIVANVREGGQAILKCNITVSIPSWTSPSGGFINSHDFNSLSPSSPFRNRMGIAANGDLIINNTHKYDRGDYLCSYPGLGKQTVRLIVGDPLSTTTKSSSTLKHTAPTLISKIPTPVSTAASSPSIFSTTSLKPSSTQSSTVSSKITTPISTAATSPSAVFSRTSPKPSSITQFETRASTTLRPTSTIAALISSSRQSFTTKSSLSTAIVDTSSTRTSRGAFTQAPSPTTTSTIKAEISSTKSLQSTAVLSTASTTPSIKSTTNSLTDTSTRTSRGAFTQAPSPTTTSTKKATRSSTKSSPLLTPMSSTRTATAKPIHTLPPIAKKCAICAGPPEACEQAFFEDYCQPPNHYCINSVVNNLDGSRLVERKCGNISTCYNDWYLGTSDDDKCRQLSSSMVLTYAFECTYCCVKDGCNVDLRPKSDTLYTNSAP